MNNYSRILDSVLLFGLAVMSFLAIAPDSFVMPTSLQMILLVSVLCLVAFFLIVLWREQPNDERELQNQALASRWAYIVGGLTLIISLLVQGFTHTIDPAVPITLLTMIATKVIIQRHSD